MPTLDFGKYRNRDLSRVDDNSYLDWILSCEDGRVGDFNAWHADAVRDQQVANNVNRALDAPVHGLNDSQQAAVDRFTDEVLDGGAPVFRLDGGAGYGKSYVTHEIARRAGLQGYRVTACAPSYVASQVLRQQLDGVADDVGTVASVCRLSKVRDEDRETYEVTGGSIDRMHELLTPTHEPRLLIVDECSMNKDDVSEPLIRIARKTGGRLLAVGDRYQLPPVGQDWPSAFYQPMPSAELTEPMRFSADSDLFTLEQIARYSPRSIHDFQIPGSTEVLLHADQRSLVSQYLADQQANPDEDARVLFYRRDDVAFANSAIRSHRYGAHADRHPVMPGEGVLVLETTDIGQAANDRGTRLYSGQVFHCEDVDERTVHDVRAPVARLRYPSGAAVDRWVALSFAGSSTAGALAVRLNELRAKARDKSDQSTTWADFYRVKNAFLPVGYSYAMTVHRCQGQTVDRVYFDPKRLQGPEGDALVYVAATRARTAVNMVR